MQWRNGGAYAEYVAVNEDALALKPSKVTFEQAATVPTSGLIALHNLSALQARLEGRRVLVNGAGGGVGAVAVQVARSLGAHVTAVDHTHKLDLLRTLGADQVVDYTTDDVTAPVTVSTSSSTWWATTPSRRTDASLRPTAPTC